MAHSFVHKSVHTVVVKGVLGSLSHCRSYLLESFLLVWKALVYKHGQEKNTESQKQNQKAMNERRPGEGRSHRLPQSILQ